jgi:60 kDa SS-A/Ro ribonucleoprotein
MQEYHKHFSTKKTPQSQPIPGTNQQQNSAGGFAWKVDDWARLDRFLILGSEGGTYYVNERELTIRNANAVMRCIKNDGKRAVEHIAEISEQGRAPKNDPALFALAMAASADDQETRVAALDALPRVARIPTHLFHFLEYCKAFRGWGRGLREAVASWYNDRDPGRLAYHVVKYQSRDGWSNRDALRLSHPTPTTPQHDKIYGWVTQGHSVDIPLISAFEEAKTADEKRTVELIQEHRLTREMINTKHLNSAAVWEALLENMPLHAMVRNLGKMTDVGLIKPMSNAVTTVASKLSDKEYIHKSRMHPLKLLVALKVYESGGGYRGSLSWNPVTQVVDALDNAFYLAFDNAKVTGKRRMLALDVSGSMASGEIAGMPNITPRVASAALAMVTLQTEPSVTTTIFSSGGTNFKQTGRGGWLGANGISTFSLSSKRRLDDVIRAVSGLPFGGTDCALPMIYALENDLEIDSFEVYTDSETWAGDIHPVQALDKYRNKTGIPAKLVVIGMTSNGFSIADPNDPGMLDVVGFDTATPNVISQFLL